MEDDCRWLSLGLSKHLSQTTIWDLTQQDNWKTQDGGMTKKCRARPWIPVLARHFFRYSAVLSLPAVLLHKVSNKGSVTTYLLFLLLIFNLEHNFWFALWDKFLYITGKNIFEADSLCDRSYRLSNGRDRLANVRETAFTCMLLNFNPTEQKVAVYVWQHYDTFIMSFCLGIIYIPRWSRGRDYPLF